MVFRDPQWHDEVRVFGYPNVLGVTEQPITVEHGDVQGLLDRRAKAVATRRNHYQAWCRQANDWAIDRQLSRDQQLSHSRDQGLDYGMEL